MKFSLQFLFFLVICIFAIASAQKNGSFAVSNFASSIARKELSAVGNFTTLGNSIHMTTSNLTGSTVPFYVTRLLHTTPVSFHSISSSNASAASFNTSFEFSFGGINNTGDAGDGFAFIITPVLNFTLPADLRNMGGGFLAMYNEAAGSPLPFVAVEFDTYNNAENGDLDDHHIGIDINSHTSAFYQTLPSWLPLKSTNGSRRLISWIDYNAANHQIDVYLAVAPSDKASAHKVLSYNNLSIWEHVLSQSYVGLTAATGLYGEVHSFHSWNFSSTMVPIPVSPQKSGFVLLRLIMPLTLGIVVGMIMVIFFLVRRRFKAAGLNVNMDFRAGPCKFTYKDLKQATDGFKNILGQGGSGVVYKGLINLDHSGKSHVAVKMLSKFSKNGEKELKSEVLTLGRLVHKNVVPLYGWCIEKDHRMLIYEFMPNGSLDRHLFPGAGKDVMDWSFRYNVLKGVASSLVYLHRECERVIIHRDIKSSNVMLDSNMNARLGDFGLAKYFDHDQYWNVSSVTGVVGTWGYVAPEYALSGRVTTESDTFSFGMLALVIACGRRPFEDLDESLLDFVWRKHQEGCLMDVVDSRLNGDFNVDEMKCMIHVGMLCTHPDPKARPSEIQVSQMLRDVTVPNLPPLRPVAVYVQIPTNMVQGDGVFTSSALSIPDAEMLSSARTSERYSQAVPSFRSYSYSSFPQHNGQFSLKKQ